MLFLNSSNKLDDTDQYYRCINSIDTLPTSQAHECEQRHTEAVSFLLSTADSKLDLSGLDIISCDDNKNVVPYALL